MRTAAWEGASVEGPFVLADWLTSDEAFEVAWRGARSCGVGKVSPAQLTAALTALGAHMRKGSDAR